ncbi:hypothetical protein [Streptomyces sp. NPDC059278]|uniref:hypothetical protein n=1 Tax=Streptomyces sp. NPDC059278 TaxID=3346801 RepID=UPI0036B11CAB
MHIEIKASDMPSEVREILRLQNQRIQRLESALTQLTSALGETGTIPAPLTGTVLALADGSGQQKLIERNVKSSRWFVSEEERWDRDDEPEWVWEYLRDLEERANARDRNEQLLRRHMPGAVADQHGTDGGSA